MRCSTIIVRSELLEWTFVCLSVCPCSKRKTTWTIDTKLYTRILYSIRSTYIDAEVKRSKGQKVKGQGRVVTKTVTIARLLVTRAATVVCCCRRASACRYDWLCFLVNYPFILSFTMHYKNMLTVCLDAMRYLVYRQLQHRGVFRY